MTRGSRGPRLTNGPRRGAIVAALRRLLPGGVLGLAGLLAVATAGAAQQARAVVRFRSYPVPIVLDSIARSETLQAPYGAVYSTVRRVLSDMDFRISLDDPGRGVLGNLRWHRSGTLAGERPSQFLNCGAGPTGPYADNFRLTLAFAAFVDDLGEERTRLGFALIGEGENVTGTGGKPAACESLGVMESQLLRLVRGRLGIP